MREPITDYLWANTYRVPIATTSANVFLSLWQTIKFQALQNPPFRPFRLFFAHTVLPEG